MLSPWLRDGVKVISGPAQRKAYEVSPLKPNRGRP
jgi:hypothetical protein